MSPLWPAGAATGIGSMPGRDVVEATRLVFGELSGLPFLPELPARGAGADLIGRGAALLVDLPVEIQPSGWRLTSSEGRELRRARDFLDRDLDALEAAADGFDGAVKVQIHGPSTMALALELPNGHRMLSDYGAVRDLAESLAEGLSRHLIDLRRRVPGAQFVVQVDEPSLPGVLAGRIPTASGYGTLRAIEASIAETTLGEVLAVAPDGGRAVHCCAADVPIALLRGSGANAVSIDASLLDKSRLDEIGETVDAEVSLWLGIVPSTDATISLDSARQKVLKLWQALGFPQTALGSSVVPTPTCGLAGASPAYARRAMQTVRDVGRALADLADG